MAESLINVLKTYVAEVRKLEHMRFGARNSKDVLAELDAKNKLIRAGNKHLLLERLQLFGHNTMGQELAWTEILLAKLEEPLNSALVQSVLVHNNCRPDEYKSNIRSTKEVVSSVFKSWMTEYELLVKEECAKEQADLTRMEKLERLLLVQYEPWKNKTLHIIESNIGRIGTNATEQDIGLFLLTIKPILIKNMQSF